MAHGRHSSLKISLCPADRSTLEGWLRSTTLSAGLVRRARIVLAIAAGGLSVTAVSQAIPISRRLVYKWAERFLADGIDGLRDKPRPGRKPTFSPRGSHSCGQDRLRAA